MQCAAGRGKARDGAARCAYRAAVVSSRAALIAPADLEECYVVGHNGCKNAFAADREAAEVLNAAMREIGAPDGKAAARENRAVLCRFVRYLSATGIRQFL